MKRYLLIPIAFLMLESAVFAGPWITGGGGGGGAVNISDAAYDPDWDGNTTDGASKNALFDKIETLGGDLLADGTVPLTAHWDVGPYTITGLTFTSDQATGTAPFTVASETMVDNLNADMLDGEEATAFEDADAAITKSDEAEVISANWDFTANPMADDEVADDITITNISQIADITATAAEINILDGVTGVTAAELSYIGDVTGLIQAQINGLVSSVGDCVSGACGDGTIDGGTYLRLRTGDFYLEINPGGLAANETFDPTDYTGTGSWAREASPVFTTNITTPQITLSPSDASPDVAGEMRYDSTVAGLSGGAIVWFDDDSVRTFVDLETLPSDDDFVVAYDSAADGFYMKEDLDTGGNTDYENIGDPGENGSIDMTGFTGTYTSATDGWGGMIFANTTADNASTTTLITGKFNDDYDTDSVYLHFINDADGGADDFLKITGLGFYFGAGTPTQVMDGQSAYFSSFVEIDGPLYLDGGLVAASADPKAILDDTGGGDAYWDNNAVGVDGVATFGVDDSGGPDQPYMEHDGENERTEFKKPVLMEDTFTASYTIVTPQALSVTTEDDVTVGTELTSSVVMLTGDDDGDHDTLTLQDGILAGTILTFIVDDVADDSDTLIIDAETDSTCTGCPDAGIFTFDDPGDKVTLYWGGAAWFYQGSYAVD